MCIFTLMHEKTKSKFSIWRQNNIQKCFSVISIHPPLAEMEWKRTDESGKKAHRNINKCWETEEKERISSQWRNDKLWNGKWKNELHFIEISHHFDSTLRFFFLCVRLTLASHSSHSSSNTTWNSLHSSRVENATRTWKTISNLCLFHLMLFSIHYADHFSWSKNIFSPCIRCESNNWTILESDKRAFRYLLVKEWKRVSMQCCIFK